MITKVGVTTRRDFAIEILTFSRGWEMRQVRACVSVRGRMKDYVVVRGDDWKGLGKLIAGPFWPETGSEAFEGQY